MTSKNSSSRHQLRQTIRQRRKSLTIEQQNLAEDQLADQLSAFCLTHSIKSLAIYLSNDGELQTNHFIEWCWSNGIAVYLPVIHPFNKHHLLFINYTLSTPMKKNRFAISEPKLNVQSVIAPSQLDALFTPLVAFDISGNRIGMGGGFYDRTLAHLNHSPVKKIGLAHDCQQVEQVPIESWDMPLSKIITPTRVIECHEI